jgi:hypothetical protein
LIPHQTNYQGQVISSLFIAVIIYLKSLIYLFIYLFIYLTNNGKTRCSGICPHPFDVR